MDEQKTTGTLYIVATPIGNSRDMSERGREILSTADIIAAEDTRRSVVLLNKLGIRGNSLSANHKFNEYGKAKWFIEQLASGKDIAVITDAGTPCISDPGNELIRAAIDAGLKYVNNDACYPSITAVGQLMEAVTSGRYDTDHLALIMSQTGGCCRASNYIAFIRRALKKAGLEHIPVISLNANGMETNEGFRISPSLLLDAAHGIVLGDLLMRCLYRVRPYELEKGSANALHRKWRDICIDSLTSEHPKYRYAQLCRGIVEDFDALPIDETLKKPRVGVVGEILVKYMPLANNHVVDLLEREGAEAVVPDLLDFFAATIYEQDFKHTHLGKGWTASASAKLGIPALQRMRRPAIEALKASKRFDPPMAINHVAELAKPFLSIGNQYGEGWFLAGEMAELITSGTPNIVCIQPFACLPNHVVGKGVIKALRAAYPGANIVAVDYDPGASEVNQLNRIKLMLTAAQRALHAQEATPKKPKPPEAPSISLPHPKVAML